MIRIIDPCDMKRHLQCAGQQDSPSNVTKNCACHDKWLSWLMPVTYETSFTMRGATGITLQPHQIYCACHAKLHSKISEKFAENNWSVSFTVRGRFDHDPNTDRHLAPARSTRLLCALRRRILYWKFQHFALRLSTQISPNTALATKSDTPRSPNTAPATKSDTATSANTAPATQSDTATLMNCYFT